eukprot:GFYU01000859.1.p1 GENE.GFYU01000859.1~~GFYU01000859.1.p1  ORF type:complete len:133 (+),score=33.40 GFYU01000859.1:102-500(+)
MISFRDFVPSQKEAYSFLGINVTNFETLSQSLAAANVWIEEAGVNVINVETVVLPSMFGKDHEEAKKIQTPTLNCAFTSYYNYDTTWYQFVRVWYEVPEAEQPRFAQKIQRMASKEQLSVGSSSQGPSSSTN